MSDAPHQLVLLRHGESAWNLENRFTGWTDVDLTAKGIAEAHEAARLLSEGGFTFDVAYTSLEIQDHKQDIEDVHTEQEGGLNKSVISLEHHDLPTLRTHLHLSKLAYWASLKE